MAYLTATLGDEGFVGVSGFNFQFFADDEREDMLRDLGKDSRLFIGAGELPDPASISEQDIWGCNAERTHLKTSMHDKQFDFNRLDEMLVDDNGVRAEKHFDDKEEVSWKEGHDLDEAVFISNEEINNWVDERYGDHRYGAYYDPFYDEDVEDEADMEAVLADREEALEFEKMPHTVNGHLGMLKLEKMAPDLVAGSWGADKWCRIASMISCQNGKRGNSRYKDRRQSNGLVRRNLVTTKKRERLLKIIDSSVVYKIQPAQLPCSICMN